MVSSFQSTRKESSGHGSAARACRPIAGASLDLLSTRTWPKVSHACTAKAETKCTGLHDAASSNEHRSTLPLISCVAATFPTAARLGQRCVSCNQPG